jgi:division/cell wall cluster transcriptional repressor MraZ
MPADFKHEIDESYKDDKGQFYLTSLDGKVIHLYPLSEWKKKEEMMEKLPSTHPAVRMYLNVTAKYGQVLTMDSQGRFTIAERLREEFRLKGELAVVGILRHIEILLAEDFDRSVREKPLTDDVLNELAKFGV